MRHLDNDLELPTAPWSALRSDARLLTVNDDIPPEWKTAGISRFDFKNCTPTPAMLQGCANRQLEEVAAASRCRYYSGSGRRAGDRRPRMTRMVLEKVKNLAKEDSDLVVSQTAGVLRDFPPHFQNESAELKSLVGAKMN